MVCLFQLKAAKTLADAVPWGAVAGKTEHTFPIAILGLFGTGAYMTSDIWTWSTGWIDVSIAGLALLALQGPLVGGRTGKQLKQALQDNGPGLLGKQARRMTRHPGLLGHRVRQHRRVTGDRLEHDPETWHRGSDRCDRRRLRSRLHRGN